MIFANIFGNKRRLILNVRQDHVLKGAEHFTVANDEMDGGGFAFGQHDPFVFVDLNLDIAERGFFRKTDGVVWVLFSEYFGGFKVRCVFFIGVRDGVFDECV